MNHTNNQNIPNQNLQNTIPSTAAVNMLIDLTKEKTAAVNAYCPILASKKLRRPGIRSDSPSFSADTRPQKRSRIEEVQEYNLSTPSISAQSIPNNFNQTTLPSTREIFKNSPPMAPAQVSSTFFTNNTIINPEFTSAPTSNGIQPSYVLSSNTILPPVSVNYSSQYLSHTQGFPRPYYTDIPPYNLGYIMNPSITQIQQHITSNPSPSSSSSTTSSQSPNNALQGEVIDLTTDSDDDCIIDEKETNRDLCWGLIESLVLILYPRPCTGGKGEEVVKLKREGITGKNQDNELFGVVEQELANVLAPLMDDKLIWTEATIPKDWSPSDQMIPLHIVIYGRPVNTDTVSSHLYDRKIILTDPVVYNVETRYVNPHNLPPGITHLNKNNPKSFKEYSSCSSGTTATRSPEDMKNQIDKVFNSLMNAESIPELDPDDRLVTTLYKHQKQALYFLMKREQYNDFTDDQINELTSLWRTRISAGRHTVYYNVVTNSEVKVRPIQMRGGIIADDMGLGKTIQIIALILGTQNEAIEFAKESSIELLSSNSDSSISSSSSTSKKTHNRKSPSPSKQSANEYSDMDLRSRGTLIICPLSTVANWEEQLAGHVQENTLNVYVYHGGARISDPSHLINYDVVITTYNVSGTEYSKQSKNTINSALQQIHWFRIILDEAHIIKDINTVQSKAACSLKAERRWCLTGTPIQNKLDDLFALIKFLHMVPFDSKENWNHYISRPIKSIDPVGISRLQTLMKCITLRRTKIVNGKPLLALPPRKDHYRYLELSDHERRLYEKIYRSQVERIKKFTEENNIMRHYVNILQSLLRLRQICAHYSLVKESDIPDDLDEEIVNDGLTPTRALMLLSIVRDSGLDQCGSCLQELVQTVVVTRCEHLFCIDCANKNMSQLLSSASFEDQKFLADCPICGLKLFSGDVCEVSDSKDIENDHITIPEEAVKVHSTKVKALLEDLIQAKKDSLKSVVFSQWTSMLDLIQDALNENDIRFTRLDGTMPRAERTQNMNIFKKKDDVSVILVSLKAGGVGLNLTAAQRVYLMDPFWNPSVENQAIDRIHRLGQTCAVDTIRFIIKNSVEEGILQLQERKLRLAELTFSEKLSKQDITRRRLEDLKVLFK
ncbi:9263_t:CDS:10 [Funneliformis geosporum]|uniref:9263_t:CDS:1 n=1 Tax=Funneliformis geosporum TaxID=1117311 RepID=A0A9W4WSG8_9GLOM|nr:9263_t:CDS:10 [Funneliformis geosporum]